MRINRDDALVLLAALNWDVHPPVGALRKMYDRLTAVALGEIEPQQENR